VLDSNVNQFTQSSTDVILLGGEDTFSPATAAKIEAAVAGVRSLLSRIPVTIFLIQACRLPMAELYREDHPLKSPIPLLPLQKKFLWGCQRSFHCKVQPRMKSRL
jgi:hypothetical protein